MSEPLEQRLALVAHEDAVCRRLLQRLLERSGFHVHLAANGEQALTALQHCSPDLALLGIVASSGAGLEILEEARRSSQSGDTRWVVVADEWHQADWEAAQALGARELLAKPFSPTQLRERIREWMRTPEKTPASAASQAAPAHTSTLEE